MQYTSWSTEEDEIVRRQYAGKGPTKLAARLGRSPDRVRERWLMLQAEDLLGDVGEYRCCPECGEREEWEVTPRGMHRCSCGLRLAEDGRGLSPSQEQIRRAAERLRERALGATAGGSPE